MKNLFWFEVYSFQSNEHQYIVLFPCQSSLYWLYMLNLKFLNNFSKFLITTLKLVYHLIQVVINNVCNRKRMFFIQTSFSFFNFVNVYNDS